VSRLAAAIAIGLTALALSTGTASATAPIVDCDGNVTVDLEGFVVPPGFPQPHVVAVVDNGDTVTVTIRRYGYWGPTGFNDETETVAKPTGCSATSTTRPPSGSSTTPAPPSESPAPGPAVSSPAGRGPASNRTLPATGSDETALLVGLALVAGGALVTRIARRRAA
jgi:LPXTG-motif cell wall-anchored protein